MRTCMMQCRHAAGSRSKLCQAHLDLRPASSSGLSSLWYALWMTYTCAAASVSMHRQQEIYAREDAAELGPACT